MDGYVRSNAAFACLHTLVQRCQVIAGVIENPTARVDAVRFAAAFRDLPPPASLVERLAVERQLEIFADQAAARLHWRMHGHSADARCGFSRANHFLHLEPG